MKTQSIRQGLRRQLQRWLAIGSVALLGAATTATAQDFSVPAGASSSVGLTFRDGALINDGQAFQVIDPSQLASVTAAAASAATVTTTEGTSFPSFLDNAVQPVGFQTACTSCGTTSCGGACGGGGLFGGGIAGGFSDICGDLCEPYQYVFAEVLYMQRQGDSRFTLSQNFTLDEFEFEIGPRITMGNVPDCVHGWETSFTGPIEWERSELRTDAGNGLNSRLLISSDLDAAAGATAQDSFNNRGYQRQDHRSEYWSFEGSRTLIGWQIAKVLYGVRTIQYNEDYSFITDAAPGVSPNDADGSLVANTKNLLIGGQLGLDLFYPISRHAYADFRGRAGLYMNLSESDYKVRSNDRTIINTGDDDHELAGVFEIGTGVRFNLGESLSIRVGSELWYLSGVATSRDQISQVVTPNSGRTIQMDDDVIIAGINASAEFKY